MTALIHLMARLRMHGAFPPFPVRVLGAVRPNEQHSEQQLGWRNVLDEQTEAFVNTVMNRLLGGVGVAQSV
jgi:hypothetical protein